MSEPVLSITDLAVRFGADEPAVSAASLTVHAGETVAVVGESGSGKSTMAAAVLGLLPGGGRIVGGRIEFAGADITGADQNRMRAIRGTGIGYVPQDPVTNLNPVWRIGFQIREALRANNIGERSEVGQQAVELLGHVGMPDPAVQARRYPHQLSGGMCQRALIAIGLAGRPRLLIADEPTSALDVTVQRQVLDHLQQMAAELGTAVLLITHDLALAAERASRVVVMHRGRTVESGAAQDILRHPSEDYTQRLVASAPALTARSAAPHVVERPPGDDLLVATDVTKVFRTGGGLLDRTQEHTAVESVSFRLPKATTLAVVGESGSGKTTLARMVLGLLTPTSGRVTFDGVDVATTDRAGELALRRRMQPVFQNPYRSLDPRYSVRRAIEEPLRIHGVGDRAQRRQRVAELLDEVALPAAAMDRRPRELSGGQRQRVAIARALALRPELVVWDEAVSALDVIVQAQILELMADLQHRLGLTYLFISHDLAVVRQVADTVIVMSRGRVVESASAEAVFTDPRDEYTRRLLDAIPGARPAL
ncbi:peptide ABC transporter ATP-binding protein [Mycolicibacterium confluentis]|uniref:Peptide ABC transporter ATP-binding protein n=2 Tax=Mycolicibacterium confluentis TaxID=28047 RepID=A0A7I7XQP0_9MYCO|nr:ABC transporter ATP-binding protein [Mycolicibacterium confluentis]BBZ31403.1 peptide ABC transporter ATP-binding protein [Mycolicibacterium confluentis]